MSAAAMTAGPMKWRIMTEADLPSALAIADAVHPDFPEDEVVFANRLALDPNGCAVLEAQDGIKGYLVSHPWQFREPPSLNSLLTMPAAPSTFYIHDLALLPETRRSGAATVAVDMMAARARLMQLPNMTLVAVNNSVHFWQRHDFTIMRDSELDQKLQSYGDNARFMVRDLTQKDLS
ncbi:GNAT family N-acetyltransferase [Tardiphaga sp. 866_E4_N2_1]|uniref:GNAT family N-acetyltransferase n=1 Tax=unclassified Tardiphaga TaxID=2631404 RepID=UPI003F242C5E